MNKQVYKDFLSCLIIRKHNNEINKNTKYQSMQESIDSLAQDNDKNICMIKIKIK